MGKVIAFGNHKGGVGKTSSVSAVASILADRGFKVLMVDLDAQANLTKHHSEDEYDAPGAKTIFSAFRDKDALPIYDVSEKDGQVLDLVPSTIRMAEIGATIAGYMCREQILRKLLKPVVDEYDFIILDCPPALGDVAKNAFTAADYVVIPMQADVLSYYGIEMLMNTISEVQEALNPNLQVLGIFFTMFDSRENITDVVLNAVVKSGLNLMNARITKDTKVKAAPLFHKSLLSFAPQTRAVTQYGKLTDEMLKLMGR